MQRSSTVTLRRNLYADAVAIVEREYADELSLDDVARRVASSRRQLPARLPRDRRHDVPST
ncbi:MAG: hypothetical protein R2736_06520 [Solirubrobacterales bacterium]